MDKKKVSAGVAALIASGSLAVDASVYDGKNIAPITETIANERVEVKQIENIVEAKAPWKGEEGITVKYDMKEPSLAEKMRDRRKEEVIYEKVEFGDGGFKIDVLLTEKPSTNKFCYTIEGAENYDFFYQPPLTPEEIAEGASRPPEIEGSYAVYHKTLKNHVIGQENYATGKVMHIPRPQVWELGNEANKVWADLSYDEKEGLCVTAPQDFIDNADYTNGVRIDPTFGYTTKGGSLTFYSNGNIEGSYFTSTENGIISSISFWMNNTGTRNQRVAIYTKTDGVLKSYSNNDSIVAVIPDHIDTQNVVNGDLSISSGVDYWITVADGQGSGQGYYDTETDKGINANPGYDSATDPPPDVGASPTLQSVRFSIYATYSVVEPVPATLRINNGTIRINNGTLDI